MKNIENYIKSIHKRIRERRIISRVLILLLSLFTSALVFNFFLKETHIVTGGANGVSLILNKIFGLNTSDTITVLMFSFLAVSLIFLGVEATSGAVISSMVYPLFVSITEHWTEFISVDTSDMLLISIFIGIVYGITNGLVFRNGFNNGGTSVISQVLYKYKRISIATSSFVLNMTIVVIGGFFFGWNMVMYAAIILYINKIVTDRILVGTSKNKVVYIITENNREVGYFINNYLKRGATEFNVRGINNRKLKAIMTVIPNSDYFKLKEGIKLLDKRAFLVVTDSYQLSGGK